MKIICYLMVLSVLAPLILFFSCLQSAINRFEWEIKFLKAEYKYQIKQLKRKYQD